MKRLFRFNKKMAVAGLAVGLVMGVGGFAFAFFTSTGTGTGSADVGQSTSVRIIQNGAVYDSLIPNNGYVQDQAYFNTITQFGNSVTLTSAGFLNSVTVAFRNWGCATTLPVTLNLYNPGSYGSTIASDTVSATFAPATNCADNWPLSKATVTNVTFFANNNRTIYVGSGVAFGVTGLIGSSVNVALASSGTNLVIGSDPNSGTVLVQPTDQGQGFEADTGCSTTLTAGVFQQTGVWGCLPVSNNTGAYGSASGADIPAIEFVMDGAGTTPPVFPGQSEYISFTVKNTGSGPEKVNTVTPSLTSVSGAQDDATCFSSGWFTFTGANVNSEIPAGGSVDGNALVSMSDPAVSQDACQGASLNLQFASN